MNHDNYFIVSAPNAKHAQLWFDGYKGQKRVIFDDFRPWWCEFSWLLRLLDRYPIQVPVKGGFVNFIPEEIIVTTPKNPEETFGMYRTQEDLQQLRRRLQHVVHFDKLSSPPVDSGKQIDKGAVGFDVPLVPTWDPSPLRASPYPSCADGFSCRSTQSESEPIS